jgi:hypothetical protein
VLEGLLPELPIGDWQKTGRKFPEVQQEKKAILLKQTGDVNYIACLIFSLHP